MAEIEAIANRIVENVENVIVGKRSAVQLTVLGLLCQGHILIEDVPGVGKTVLAKSLSKSVGCKFQRIQFTPDLLPADLRHRYDRPHALRLDHVSGSRRADSPDRQL